MPIRSMSASGPIGQPAPARSARSTSSGAAPVSSSIRTASLSMRDQQAVDEEARACPGTARPPCRGPAANASAVANASSSTTAVRTTSTSGISGAGLKKCRPTTRSGRPLAGRDRRHRQRRGVGREDRLGPAEPVERPRTARPSGRAPRRSPRSPGRRPRAAPGRSPARAAPARRVGRRRVQHALLGAPGEARLDAPAARAPAPPSSTSTRDHAMARLQAHLRDARTHRPEPHDPDGRSPSRATSWPRPTTRRIVGAWAFAARDAGPAAAPTYTGAHGQPARSPPRGGASAAAGGLATRPPAPPTRRALPPPSTAVVVPRPAAVPRPPGPPSAPAEAGAARSDHREAIALRRERRPWRAATTQLQRDIGGLAIEMARQANYNYPLLRARSDEALRIEQRVAEIDRWLESEIARRRLDRVRQRAPAARAGDAASRPRSRRPPPPARAAPAPSRARRTSAAGAAPRWARDRHTSRPPSRPRHGRGAALPGVPLAAPAGPALLPGVRRHGWPTPRPAARRHRARRDASARAAASRSRWPCSCSSPAAPLIAWAYTRRRRPARRPARGRPAALHPAARGPTVRHRADHGADRADGRHVPAADGHGRDDPDGLRRDHPDLQRGPPTTDDYRPPADDPEDTAAGRGADRRVAGGPRRLGDHPDLQGGRRLRQRLHGGPPRRRPGARADQPRDSSTPTTGRR